jgi:DNA-binding transcriptional LysR family regulator
VRACDVGSDELTVVVSPSHRWARRSKELAVAELTETPMVSREPNSGTRQAWERAVRDQLSTTPAPPILEVSSATALKEAVMIGIGPAVLSTRVVAAELAAGTLVEVTVPELNLRRRLHAIWAESNSLHGAAADLLSIALRA